MADKKRPAHRPPFWDDPDAFYAQGLEWLEQREKGDPVTMSGLAFALGFTSRQSLWDYGRKPEFAYVVKRLKLLVEAAYEERMHGNNPTGAIFVLKNMGWSDRQDVQLSGDSEAPVEIIRRVID